MNPRRLSEERQLRPVTEPREEDFQFCLDHVEAHDPWYRLHLVFASRASHVQITATQALFVMLERAIELSEESLVLTQLAWWRQELQPDRTAMSAHPVIRALRESNNAQLPHPATMDALIGAQLERSQAESVVDPESLRALCERLGWPMVCAHLGVNIEDKVAQELAGHCAVSGLLCLIDSALRKQDKSWWFVPLTLQAKHQLNLNSTGLTEQNHASVLAVMLELSGQWAGDQRVFLGQMNVGKETDLPALRYLVAKNASHLIRLNRTRKHLGSQGQLNPGKWGIGDMLRVWSACRSFSKAAR